MGAYDLDTVVKKWERAELSTEQAIGQILLLLDSLSKRVGRLERDQSKIRRHGQSTTKTDTDPP